MVFFLYTVKYMTVHGPDSLAKKPYRTFKILQDPPGSLKISQRSSKIRFFQGSLKDPAQIFKDLAFLRS